MTDELAAAAAPLPPRQSIRRNTQSLLLAQIGSWVLAFAITYIQPRIIGADNIGQISYAQSLWTIAGVFIMFGLNSVIVVGTAKGTSSNQEFRSAMGLESLLYLVAVVVVVGYSLIAGYRGQLLALILILGAATLAGAYVELGRAALYGRERMAWPSRVDITNKALSTVLTILVLVLGGRAVGISILGTSLMILYMILMLAGVKREAGLDLRPSYSGLGGLARQSLPFLMIEAAVVVYRQSDTVFIKFLTDDKEVGWYSVAESFLGSLLVVPTIVLSAAFPALARLSSEDPEQGANLVRRGLKLLFVVTTPLGFGAIVAAPQFAPLVFGNQFRESAAVLAVMGVVMIIMVPAILVGNYAVAIGRQSQWAWITVVSFIVSIPLNLLLIPYTDRHYANGAIGAAIVFALTELLIFALAVMRVIPTLFDRATIVGVSKTLAAGLLMLAASYPLHRRFLLIPIAVGGVVYVGAVAALRTLAHEDRELLKSPIRKIAGRFRRSS